jgi:hypothetical protein
MRGEFVGVWSETWREIWSELAALDAAPDDLFCDLYRELARGLIEQPSIEGLADIIESPVESREAFERVASVDLAGERSTVAFLESAHEVLDQFSGDKLTNHYFNLLEGFINKFSLRYDLRRPCILCPTLPGIFTSLMRDLKTASGRDAHLDMLMKEFEGAVRDLRSDCSDGRIKTCIQKQVNLLEAIAAMVPGVTGNTLGAMCNQLATWPHEKIKDAMKNLYGFASDYPGIRHGGTPAHAIRTIEMRDMVAMSILLAGFTPYLTEPFNADGVYRGV